MENNLLDAMQDDIRLGGIKNFERVVNQSSHESLKNCILDLLEKQREKCKDEAELSVEDFDNGITTHPKVTNFGGIHTSINKQSILNAKLIETQNKQ